MKEKMLSANKLLKSKVYILITEREAIMQGDFKGFDSLMRISALRSIRQQIDDLLHAWQKEGNDGRKQDRRAKSRPSKPQAKP